MFLNKFSMEISVWRLGNRTRQPRRYNFLLFKIYCAISKPLHHNTAYSREPAGIYYQVKT